MYNVLCSLLFYSLVGFVTGSFGLFFSLVLYLHHLHKIHDHLPGPPRSSFFLGNIPEIREYRRTGGTLGEYYRDKHFQYGPVFLIFFLHRPIVIIGDPVYVRDLFVDFQRHILKSNFLYQKLGFIFGERGLGYGLLTNTDEESWRKRRQLMNPAFHKKCLKNFMADFNQVCDRFLKRMENVVDNKEQISMVGEFGKVTLDIISKVSFNISVEAIEHPESRFPTSITSYLRGVQANLNSPLSASVLSVFQIRLFQSSTQKEQMKAAKFLRKFAFECITNRMRDIEANKEVPDDLLNILVNDKTLTMDDIIDEFVTVFIAGQETTANSLAFTLYEVIRNPDIEAKLLKEIEAVLGKKEHVEFEDLAMLKYLGQVLQESLRKYPVAEGPSRVLDKEVTVGSYKIPKGTNVCTSKTLLGYSPKFWKNPDVFDPERFSSPENIPNFSILYSPFTVGHRNCIGQTLAKFESKVILAQVLRKFRFKLVPGQTAAMEERMTIAPRDGVMCEVMKR